MRLRPLSRATTGGVAVAGGVLELSSQMNGGELTLQSFQTAWFVVAGVSLLSAIWFWRLPPDAGSDVSGHRAKSISKPTETEI